MRTRLASVILAAVMVFGVSSLATASPITGAEPWGEFLFGGVGSFATAGAGAVASSGGNSFYLEDPGWTFTGPATLLVVDAFLSVDQFEIYDNNILVGSTSAPVAGGSGTSDPVVAWGEANYSRGVFAFGGGDHSITIKMLQSGAGAGAAYVCIRDCGVSVPEPGTLLLLGSGLFGLGLAVVRRK